MKYVKDTVDAARIGSMRGNADRCMTNGIKVFGYRQGEDGRYEVDPVEGPLVREMFGRYLERQPSRLIAAWLDHAGIRTRMGTRPTDNWVLKRIHDERYTGVYVWDDRRVVGGMPALVSREDWEAAQERRRPSDATRRVHDYPLSGILTDEETGGTMFGYSAKGKSGRSYAYYAVSLGGGRRATIRSWVVDSAVAGAIRELMARPDVASEVADRVVAYSEGLCDTPELDAARRRIVEIGDWHRRMVSAVGRGIPLDGIKEQAEEMNAERDRLRRMVAEAGAMVVTREEVLRTIEGVCRDATDADLISGLVEGVSLDRANGLARVRLRLHGKTPSDAAGNGRSEGVRAKCEWWPRQLGGAMTTSDSTNQRALGPQ